ncbi:MAG: LysR family transcriptional regulator [Pseudomonadota bacterium]
MDQMRALETLVAVADTGGFSAAARQLSISAPSVTRVIQELETDLGVTLFHRTTRTVTLTDAGDAFVADARQLIEQYQAATDAVRGAFCQPTGRLRITAPTLFGQHYIAPLLAELVDAFPDLEVDAVFLDRVVSLVDEGFDIAVRIGPLPDSNLRATRVGEVRRVVCGCPSYFKREGLPRQPEDLVNHRIIRARPVTPTDEWRFKDQRTVRIKPQLNFSSVAAAISAAQSGLGLTRVLSYQIGPELGGGSLKTVLSDWEPPALPVNLVHAEGTRISAKVRQFLELATPKLREHPHLVF